MFTDKVNVFINTLQIKSKLKLYVKYTLSKPFYITEHP